MRVSDNELESCSKGCHSNENFLSVLEIAEKVKQKERIILRTKILKLLSKDEKLASFQIFAFYSEF